VYDVWYGDECGGHNQDEPGCVKCSDPTVGPPTESCVYQHQQFIRPANWDPCESLQCEPAEEFAVVPGLIEARNVADLSELLQSSSGKAYYAESRQAVQIFGCSNAVAGSFPIDDELAVALVADLARRDSRVRDTRSSP
jgi:hypothetical protein